MPASTTHPANRHEPLPSTGDRRSRHAQNRPPASRLERRRAARRRTFRRRRRTAALALLAVAALLIGVDFAGGASGTDSGTVELGTKLLDPDGSGLAGDRPDAPELAAGGPGETSASDGEPSGEPADARAGSDTKVVRSGAGTFTVAPGRTATVGRGQLLRYRVEVENGIGQRPDEFAGAVDQTLGDPRGWTSRGQWAFQRVPDKGADFTVYLASPGTTDRLCAGLDTRGYTSCRTGDKVVINSARWLTGVSDYRGDLPTYRMYVVNHEVGHRLGYGHVACRGPGQVAGVMQQQSLGLKGCRKNPWPYVDGRLLGGPAVP